MLGWLSRDVLRASSRKRAASPPASGSSAWSTLTATRVWLHRCRASYTVAVPPRPISRTTSYRPPIIQPVPAPLSVTRRAYTPPWYDARHGDPRPERGRSRGAARLARDHLGRDRRGAP